EVPVEWLLCGTCNSRLQSKPFVNLNDPRPCTSKWHGGTQPASQSIQTGKGAPFCSPMAHRIVRSRQYEVGRLDDIVPVLEQAARGAPRAEADRDRACGYQIAACRHLHPGKGLARRGGVPAGRHQALRNLRTVAPGVRPRPAL